MITLYLIKESVDIEYDPKVLNIFSPVVLRMIKNGISGWEDMVPAYVDNVIKQKIIWVKTRTKRYK